MSGNNVTFLISQMKQSRIIERNHHQSVLLLFDSEIHAATTRFDPRIIRDVQQLQFVCHCKHFYLLNMLFVIGYNGIV